MIHYSDHFHVWPRYKLAFYRVLTPVCCFFIISVFETCKDCSTKNNANTFSGSVILLFNGIGTSPNDVTAIETLLDHDNLKYTTVNSSELNEMGEMQMMRYRLLIVPGGNFIDMGNNLKRNTAAKIRYAVQHGLHYLGICAGAFLAGNSSYYNGFNLTSGITFNFYSAVNTGINKASVTIIGHGNTTLDQYWENGPQLSGWGKSVAMYPDGTPAITDGKCGSGYVLLSGIHPEAPESWRGEMVFNTSAKADNAYAAMLIHEALNGVTLIKY